MTDVNKSGCRVCDTVGPGDLIELDALMGDSSRWPATVWGQFEPPAGPLTGSFRRFGAVEMGLALLKSKGIEGINRGHMRRHYRFDVPIVAISPADFVGIGVEQTADGRSVIVPSVVDPLDYLKYYGQGIKLGIAGLRLLEARIDKLVKDGKADEIPMSTIKMIADIGAKLATSQAKIRASGQRWGDESDAEEGFRQGSEPPPSPRMGHARIRTVEGVARPVRDEGPADRAAYNRRAREEGSPLLPGE